MMTKQRTADYTLHFTKLAAELAKEQEGTKLHTQMSGILGYLSEMAGLIQALAQEAEMSLNTSDSHEVTDFEANWRQALNWWNNLVVEFTRLLAPEAKERMRNHMSDFFRM